MSTPIYTRKRMGLDNNVLLTMLVLVVLSTGLFGYSVFKKKRIKECTAVQILVNGKDSSKSIFYNTGDLLAFRISVEPMDKVQWDFGDRTKFEEGAAVGHIYNRQSRFTVRALVNGRCTYERKILIQRPPDIVDTAGIPTQYIIYDDPAFVKVPVTFTTPLDAQTYEWHIENNSNYKKQTGKEVKFIFNSQDTYTVVLMLNGDRQKRYTQTITVIKASEIVTPTVLIEDQKIEEAAPPRPKQPDSPKVVVAPPVVTPQPKRVLSNEQFKLYLQDVVCKGMKPEQFLIYLCGGMQTRVLFGKKSETFDVFCNAIQGKNIRIKSVVANRNADNCVLSLEVEYVEPKKILGVGKTVCDE